MNSKFIKSTFHFACLSIMGLAVLTTSTGCLGGLGLTGANVPAEPISAESAGQYQVEMSGGFTKSSVFQGELDGPLTIQDALERSGATDKFRGMDVMIYRVVQDTGRGLKLKVDYKASSKSVQQEFNYALHPNDRIVVSSRSSNPLDKLVDSFKPGTN